MAWILRGLVQLFFSDLDVNSFDNTTVGYQLGYEIRDSKK